MEEGVVGVVVMVVEGVADPGDGQPRRERTECENPTPCPVHAPPFLLTHRQSPVQSCSLSSACLQG